MSQLIVSNQAELKSLLERHGAVLIAAEFEEQLVVKLADPATVAALWEIAKGILASLGAKALGKWLGLDGGVDLEAFLRGLISEIEQAIKGVLDARDIAAATAQVEAATILLNEYVRSPESSEYKLQAGDVESLKAVKELERLLPVSVNAYVFAALTRLSALQQRVLITRSDGDLENLAGFAQSCISRIDKASSDLTLANESRVSPIVMDFDPGEPGGLRIERPGGIPPRYKATYYIDGIRRDFWSRNESEARSKAEASRQSDLDIIRREFNEKVRICIEETKRQMVAIRDWRLPT